MRTRRAKTYKRAMAMYIQLFGFRQPFQILVSHDILLRAAKGLNVPRQLQLCVQGEVKLMMTQCCIEALYKLGKEQQAATDLAKTFERRKCNHRTAIDPQECLRDVVGTTNKHRYVLAAQSYPLRTDLANIPGLPIIHFNPKDVLVLSPPSTATIRVKQAQEEEHLKASAKELEGVEDLGNVIMPASAGQAGPSRPVQEPRSRPKVRGPNPLSVKKKKVAKSGDGSDGAVGKKRQREDGDKLHDAQPGATHAGADAEDAEERQGGKKRKRRRKAGAVAEAIADLRAEAARKPVAAT